MTSRQKPGRSRSGEIGSVRTLERGLSVLLALRELRRAPLSVLARQVGLPASTTYRLLETLRQSGFIEWEEASGQFSIGLRAYQVGLGYAGRSTLTGAAHPEMEALVAELNETVNLAVLHGSEAVYLHQVEGRQLVRMFTHLGASAPLHCTGVGKALLAWSDPSDVVARLGPGPYPQFTPHSLTTLPAYQAALAAVRAQGYALDDEERELGVRCLAAPLRGEDGAVVAALSLSAPTARFGRERVPVLAARLGQAAGRISARLGWNDAE